MSTYLQTYGAGEEKRNRIIKTIILTVLGVLILSAVLYETFKNFRETQLVKHFLVEVNQKKLPDAYRTWGCTSDRPCRDYQYSKFMEDWGKSAKQWEVRDVESCATGVLISVGAQGAENQPLWVEKGTNTIGFAPFPDCVAKKWRWGQFFDRLRGKEPPPPPMPNTPR